MENIENHSIARLALAVFTCPGAAFEEITRRRLLGPALGIVALTGVVSTVPPLIAVSAGQKVQWLMLGQYSPIAWLGLCMLYVFAMQKLLKWIGSQVDYVGLLTLMGWSQLSLLFAEMSTILLSYGAKDGGNASLGQVGLAGVVVFSIWYVILMGSAIHALSGAPKARGIMAYIVIQIAAGIAFSYTYTSTRLSAFQDALPGVNYTAGLVAYADKLPWAGASVAGLIIGAVMIGKHYSLPISKVRLYAVIAGAVGLVMFGTYAYKMSDAGYYGKLLRAHRAYITNDYAQSITELNSLLPVSKDNVRLMLDIADLHFLARQDDKALAVYSKVAPIIVRQEPPDKKALLSRAYDGEGAIFDLQKRYPEAMARFEKASKEWPEFREPWIRMAVTYNRMGKYDQAIESANHALKKLESEATVAWVAIAEAFAQTGDVKQAKAAIAMVVGRDQKLAARIGSGLDDWKHAVDKLNREDLRFPLENKMAPEPKKPVKPKKK